MAERGETIVVDVGGSKLIAARARHAAVGPLVDVRTPAGSATEFARLLAGVIRSADPEPGRIVVAIPGSIDERSGVVTEVANFSFTSIPLKAALETEFGVTVDVVGDVEAAAVAEFGAGAARRADAWNGVYLTVSTGIGAGLVVDGSVLLGDGVGELGHARVPCNEGRRCGCGGVDCLETYSSGSGIVARATERANASPALRAVLDRRPLTARDVYQAGLCGDSIAREVFEDSVEVLSLAVHGLIRTFAPEVIVLGGGVALGTDLRRRLERATRHLSHGSKLAVETSFLSAGFGRRSVLVGAALLAQPAGARVCPRQLAETQWGRIVKREEP